MTKYAGQICAALLVILSAWSIIKTWDIINDISSPINAEAEEAIAPVEEIPNGADCPSNTANISSIWVNDATVLSSVPTDTGTCIILVRVNRAHGYPSQMELEVTIGEQVSKDSGHYTAYTDGFMIPSGSCAKVVAKATWSNVEPDIVETQICAQAP